MFWTDIADIKQQLGAISEWMTTISSRMTDLQMKYDHILQEHEDVGKLCDKSIDRSEECLKNVEKLNTMTNEFKGCVTVARGALEERKKLTEQEQKTAVLAEMTKEIQTAMKAFITAGDKLEHKAHFKIDYIYNKMEKFADFLHDYEKKSRKAPKVVKKKRVVSPVLESE